MEKRINGDSSQCDKCPQCQTQYLLERVPSWTELIFQILLKLIIVLATVHWVIKTTNDIILLGGMGGTTEYILMFIRNTILLPIVTIYEQPTVVETPISFIGISLVGHALFLFIMSKIWPSNVKRLKLQ